MKRRIAFLLCAELAAGAASAESSPAPSIQVSLLAPDAVSPGQTVDLGVRIDIEPEWHIYWKNPGSAGLPTLVDVHAPDGAQVGELRWPLPIRFVSEDGAVGYGYSRSVTLWRTVTVPDRFTPGQSLPLDVDVEWLACKLRCIPGSHSESLTLPVVADATNGPRPAERFAQMEGAPFRVRTTTGVAGRRQLVLAWPGDAPTVEWFPAPPEPYWVENVNTESNGNETTIVYTLRSSGRPSSATGMETIVTFEDADGNRHGYTVMVPIA